MYNNGIIGGIIKHEREKLGLDQAEFGLKIGASQSQLSRYEAGKKAVPDDIISNIIRLTKSVTLIQTNAVIRKVALYNIPPLNNIDTRIMTVLHVFEKESLEAADAALQMRNLCLNKRSKEDFKPFEYEELLKHIEQMVDLYSAINVLTLVAHDQFGVDPDEIAKRLTLKYIDKKYIK